MGAYDGKTVYCHFSFRRPRGKDYGLFAVAFYLDKEGKRLTAQATRRIKLWEDQQFVAAIQSYEHALYSIYNWQGIMKSKGITTVMLVTDNSTLAGWIENPKKNKWYTQHMNRAVEQYKAGGVREIVLSVGLCDVLNYEKSYKFCKEDKVINDTKPSISVVTEKLNDDTEIKVHAIDLSSTNLQYKTILQLEEEANNMNKPEIVE